MRTRCGRWTACTAISRQKTWDFHPNSPRDLNAWADAYTSSLNRADPGNSLWSAEQQQAHERGARPLAVRLARERPDLTIFVLEGATGVVEVRADEQI